MTACGLKTLFLAIFATLLLSFASLDAASAASAAPSAKAPPPEKVQELIKLLDDPDIRAWLAAKSPPPSESAGKEVDAEISDWTILIRNHLIAIRDAVPRIPADAANAVAVVKADINNRGFATIFGLFAVLVALGFGAEWLFKQAIRGLKRRSAKLAAVLGGPNHQGLVVHLVSETAPVVVFFLVSAGAFLAFEWPALLREIILRYLVAFIAVRAVMAIARLLLSPSGVATPDGENAPLRLIPARDLEADFWYRRVVVFAGYFMAGWATVRLLPAMGFPPDDTRLVAYSLGIGLLVLAIEAVWRRSHRVTGAAGHLNIMDWLVTAYLVLLWGVWVAGLYGLLWLGIYALVLPKVLRGAGGATETLARRMENPESPNTIRTVIIVRCVRALVIVLAAAWLVYMLRMSPLVLAVNETIVDRVSSGVLHGVIILILADLLWQVMKAYIDRKLAASSPDEANDPSEAARRARLLTLLPIFRNMLAVVVATVAVLMVLSGLGVQIGPLIAGAGIFGVAIGFGSQTLVKDVISGVFYMLDDGFRVGEYIQRGNYKGTVESFSLRSVKLRRHRGQVFAVPFRPQGG